MKVRHLIRELQKCDPEALVWTEGCDCDGDSHRVEVGENDDGSPAVTICRQFAHYGRSRPAWPAEVEDYDNEDDTPDPLPPSLPPP